MISRKYSLTERKRSLHQLTFNDKAWYNLEDLAKRVGLEPNELIVQALLTYRVLLDMYNHLDGTQHSVEVHSKKWKLLDNSRYQSYPDLAELLGIEDK